MKKTLVSVFALTALVGCAGSYDYYKGGVKYSQEGEDCVYYIGEEGHRFNREISDMDNSKKIVYRNTRCADLYERDNLGQEPRHDRRILVPAAREVTVAQPVQVSAPSCGCATCGQPVLKRRYVIVAQ